MAFGSLIIYYNYINNYYLNIEKSYEVLKTASKTLDSALVIVLILICELRIGHSLMPLLQALRRCSHVSCKLFLLSQLGHVPRRQVVVYRSTVLLRVEIR